MLKFKQFALFTILRNKDSLSFLRSSLASLVLKALSIGLVMLIAVLLARHMGATEYGRLAYIQSAAFLISAACALGLRESANRIVARYAARRQFHMVSRFLLFGLAAIAVTSLLGVAAFHQTVTLFPEMAAKYAFPLPVLTGIVFSLAVLSFLAPAVVALGRPVLSFALQDTAPRLFLLGVSALYLLGGGILTAETVLDLSIAGNLAMASILAMLAFIRVRLPSRAPGRISILAKNAKAWLSISLVMLSSDFVFFVSAEVSMLVLGAYAAPADVALYQVARRISELISICGGVSIYLAMPRISGYYTLRNYEHIQQVIRLSNVIALIPGTCFAFAMLIGGHMILHLFGREFGSAYTILVILAMGRFLDLFWGPVLECQLMMGQQKIAGGINIVVGILNVIMNLLLIPFFGGLGAALATVLVNSAGKITLYVVLRRRIPVETCLPADLLRRFGRRFRAPGTLAAGDPGRSAIRRHHSP